MHQESERTSPAASSTVSVLIPTYNRAAYIEECIEGVLAQTCPPHQVIVIDDGSTDDTVARLGRFGDRITVLRKANGGKSSALNLGMQHVTGAFVWIFDDDDVPLANSIQMRLESLARWPNAGFAYTAHFLGFDDANRRIARGERYHLPSCRPGELLSLLLKGCFFTQQSVLARTACYRALGCFDESLARSQDYEMLIRLARNFDGIGIDEPSLIFRRHEGARGPEHLRHASFDRERLWLKFDQVIGRRIRETLSLEEFAPALPDRPVGKRTALLHRMAAMASKGLIDEAFDDLGAAIDVAPYGTLDAGEVDLCRQAICHSYFQLALTDQPSLFFDRIARLHRCPCQRQVLRVFARSMLWMARSADGSVGDRFHRLWQMLRLARSSFGQS